MAARPPDIAWMPAPQAPVGCPPGLEYLSQIDQLLVHQQVELLEGRVWPIPSSRVPVCESSSR